MKKTRTNDRKKNATVIATLCAVAVGCLAAWAQDTPIGGLNQPQPKEESMPAPSQPMRMNKCSHLIGTTVENPQGDKLGRIDDVVVDYDNGRVSYCVLSVEHGVFSKPKYLALPLGALQASADGTRLILNADKDKVAQAQGFDRDHWPSVTNPAWGAQPFWQMAPKATITAPPKQTQSKPSGTSY